MKDKKRTTTLIILFVIIALLFVGAALTGGLYESEEDIQVMMKDAVVHDANHVMFFGMEVNPAVVSAYLVSAILIVLALIIRIFLIPKFTLVPGKVQSVIEMLVGLFDGMAKNNSHHLNKLLGGYIFVAACYIFTGTCFELFGIQVVTTEGLSISLPAPLADVNGAICMGCLSYLFIMSGGIAANGVRGVGLTLKEFSLPISMSFRLFGALLSGALVTELVYYYPALSYGVPFLVGIIFTLLHAIIQSYVLTTLVSIFYGEVSEPPKPKEGKKAKKPKATATVEAAA